MAAPSKVAVHHDDGTHEEHSFHTCGHCRETVECSPENDHPKECKIPGDYTCSTCEQTILRGTKFTFGRRYDNCVSTCKAEDDIGVFVHAEKCVHHHNAPLKRRAKESWDKFREERKKKEAECPNSGDTTTSAS